MTKAAKSVQIIMGLVFVVFGLNGFLNFIPQPPLPEGPTLALMSGLMQSVYFFPLLKGTEVICGIALLSGYFVPLALIILAPIIINILMFHAFLTPEGLPMALGLAAMGVYLGRIHKVAYLPLFKAK